MPSTILGEHATTLPTGTTAQRPSSPLAGASRYNTTTGTMETYDGTGWQPWDSTAYTNTQAFTSSGTFTVPAGVKRLQVLVVAGGGSGGGYYYAGGGGAGGVIFEQNYKVTPAQVITATVGAGGAQQTGAGIVGNNGVNSSFGTLTAIGGGGGGSGNTQRPRTGGSGGGGTLNVTGGCVNGQGSVGGTPAPLAIGTVQCGAGGGGAGAPGGDSATTTDGAWDGNVGGAGLYFPMFTSWGSPAGYFGGGGGGSYNANSIVDSRSGNVGGIGGGGRGGTYPSAVTDSLRNGTANTGGGGGGAMHIGNANSYGAPGGSGIIIVAWYQ